MLKAIITTFISKYKMCYCNKYGKWIDGILVIKSNLYWKKGAYLALCAGNNYPLIYLSQFSVFPISLILYISPGAKPCQVYPQHFSDIFSLAFMATSLISTLIVSLLKSRNGLTAVWTLAILPSHCCQCHFSKSQIWLWHSSS